MVSRSVLLPGVITGGIVAGMLIFIWWWFPRTWKKGNKDEAEEFAMSLGARADDGLTQKERRQIVGQHAREYLQAMEARNKARAEGREPDGPPPVYQPFGRALRNQPPAL